MNTAQPLVTIAIPTYNRADGYLKNAITCVLNQTYKNIEIIISDNCSTDDTEAVVKGFRDPRIVYFKHKENIGANNNFNFCLQQASGAYFLLFHDDDMIDHDFVDVCMRAAHYKTDYGIIRTGTRIINGEGRVIRERPNMAAGLTTEEFFRGWFAGKTVLYLCSTLFNTIKLREIGGFRSKHNVFQDGVAEVQLAAKFGRVDVEDVKASFRKHPNEMTYAVKVRDWCEDSLMLLDLMCTLVPKEHAKIIRDEGEHFFSRLNYHRARSVKSPIERLSAYLLVFRKFNYRHLPPNNDLFSPIYMLLYGTPLYEGMRSIKKRIINFRRPSEKQDILKSK